MTVQLSKDQDLGSRGADPAALLKPGSPELATLLEAIGEESAVRERDRIAPHAQIDLIRAARFGALRVPIEFGGAGTSLLPIGMTQVEGVFARGDVVAIRDAAGAEVARGLANYSSAEARLLCRKPSSEINGLLGYMAESEMVHRDNMVLSRQ